MNEYPEAIFISLDEMGMTNSYCPRVPCDTDKNYIKHVYCDGARFHVISFSNLGEHCSEKNCIINKPKEN